MRSNPLENDVPLKYAIRLTERARREIGEAHEWLASVSGEFLADEWEARLAEALTNLSVFPTGYPLAANQERFPGMSVRYMLYRRRPSGQSAYHVFFVAESDTEDGPLVTIFHLRHTAKPPMTRFEAKGLLGDLKNP